jgi:hypothetical protein
LLYTGFFGLLALLGVTGVSMNSHVRKVEVSMWSLAKLPGIEAANALELNAPNRAVVEHDLATAHASALLGVNQVHQVMLIFLATAALSISLRDAKPCEPTMLSPIQQHANSGKAI